MHDSNSPLIVVDRNITFDRFGDSSTALVNIYHVANRPMFKLRAFET